MHRRVNNGWCPMGMSSLCYRLLWFVKYIVILSTSFEYMLLVGPRNMTHELSSYWSVLSLYTNDWRSIRIIMSFDIKNTAIALSTLRKHGSENNNLHRSAAVSSHHTQNTHTSWSKRKQQFYRCQSHHHTQNKRMQADANSESSQKHNSVNSERSR